MTVTDYIPHSIVVAFAGVVSYVFKQHAAQDDRRFTEIQTGLKDLADGQTTMAKSIADNHAEVLKLFITAGQTAATNAAIAAVAAAKAVETLPPRA